MTDEPAFPRPLVNLRQYIEEVAYLDTDQPEDLRLLVESTVPPFTDQDVYAARISGADQREAQAAFAGKPVAEYVPGHSPRRDPVTGELEEVINIGASDRDPTSVSASTAPLNRWILQQQPAARPYIRRIPRPVVLACVDTLGAADIQSLRNMWRMKQVDKAGHPRLTVRHLANDRGCSRQAIHQRHKHALQHLLDALLAWHAAHPEASRIAA